MFFEKKNSLLSSGKFYELFLLLELIFLSINEYVTQDT